MIDDILLAILSLPVCVTDLRAKISPLLVASDASEWGPGLSRTSSLTAQGQVALQGHLAGHTNIQRIGGFFYRALRRFGGPASNSYRSGTGRSKPLGRAIKDRVADFSNNTLPQIVEKAPHVGRGSIPSHLLAAYSEFQEWSAAESFPFHQTVDPSARFSFCVRRSQPRLNAHQSVDPAGIQAMLFHGR